MKLSISSLSIIIIILFTGISLTAGEEEGSSGDMKKVKESENFVPEWAKEVVWYQIFPERFRNSDESNDPDLLSIKGSWPHDFTSAWEVHPWNSDWYRLQEWEKKNGKDVFFNIQRRRYGGDLQGIIDKLDYIKEMGIGAIYLNPVFEAPSMHKYDGATYHHIDPFFGPDPEGDKKLIESEEFSDSKNWVWTSADKLFLELLKEAHKRNIRVIIDGVFNHMGLNSPAFIDVKEKQQKSKYKDWFKILSWDDEKKGTKFEYSGWYGVKELPELYQDSTGIAGPPKKYIFDITERWMDPDGDGDPSDGIDGWRLDVAFMIGHGFWKDWRQKVKSVNPESYITAEIIEPIDYNIPFLEGDEFDAVMNYNFAFSCEEYFISDSNKINTVEFDRQLKELREAYPLCVAYVMQNLLGSHDTQRILSHIVNKNIGPMRNWGSYYEKTRAANKNYETRRPDEHEINIYKLMVIFQMSYLGAPMIYYGDEAGMWGANDPCCRKPMVWPDMNYEPETVNPDQSPRKEQNRVYYNENLYDHIKKYIGIRNKYKALQKGNFNTVLAENEGLYAFSREYEGQYVLVIINNTGKDQKLDAKHTDGKSYIDAATGMEIKPGQIEVKPYWGRILVREK